MRSRLNTLSALLAGTCLSASVMAQPAATDLGTITLGTPVSTEIQLAGNQIFWFRFDVTSTISFCDLNWMDIFTVPVAGTTITDTEVGLYRADGTLVASDDDDGQGNFSALSFGTGNDLAPSTGAIVSNGRDTTNFDRVPITPGTYYVAVGVFNVTFGTTAFNVTSTGTVAGPVTLTVNAGGFTAPTAPSATDLGTLGTTDTRTQNFDLAAGEVRWFRVVAPTASAAIGTFLDMDTEGTLLAAANSTRISIYNRAGRLALTDTIDGSGNLSQISFGTGTRPAVGNGLTYNGRDGILGGCEYFIAVSSVTSAAGAANFAATSTSTNTGPAVFNLRNGAQPTNPTGVGAATPNTVVNDTDTSITLTVNVTPGNFPVSSGLGVTIDGVNIGQGAITLLDDGVFPDVLAGDRIFTASATVVAGTPTGARALPFTITDLEGRLGNGTFNVTVTQPPPPNDLCANAIALSQGLNAFNTANATIDPNGSGADCLNRGNTSPSIWYTYTSTTDGSIITIETCGQSTNDTVIARYADCADAASTQCSDDACGLQSRITFAGVAGQVHLIRVSAFGAGLAVAGNLSVTESGAPLAATGAVTTPVAELSTVTYSLTVTPGTIPASTNIQVVGDLSAVGGSGAQAFVDDGTNGDVTAGDGIYTAQITLTTGQPAGPYASAWTVTDNEGRVVNGTFNLTVNAVNGACCTGSDCAVMGAVACINAGGTYEGAGTICGGDAFEITVSNEAFVSIAGVGQQLATISGCDDCAQTASIGFVYNYLGTDYSEVSVCSNGFVQFGGTAANLGNVAIPNVATPNNLICGLWDDLNPATNGDIYILVEGEVGSQRCTISWEDVAEFGAAANRFNFQIVLFEGSNNFEIRYGAIQPQGAAGDYTIGYENIDGTLGGAINPVEIGGGFTARLATRAIVPGPCGCSLDLNNDGNVDPDDLADAIACFFDVECNFDFDGSGEEDPDDLADYIAGFFTPDFCN